ncbi:MAG: serine/threonine protein kinase [Deltaproteobacteria bacterium]|nr:serine/threonine protein kinase [Deltaproteobacteria bacterium]
MAEDPKSTVGGTVMPTLVDDATAGGAAPIMPTFVGKPADSVAAAIASGPPQMARYELGPEIARGGMGRVVEATDTTLGRVVAFKEALSRDADTLKRFERETRITARLEHPSIVPVHDAGIGPGGSPFYVMRKIGGRPLEKFVATGETLESRLALVPHMVAAANAIAHAHERGIVHRDIKPSNILVGDLGETIVIDWGLAKVVGEADEAGLPALVDPDDQLKTRVGIVYGTPGFMAPEQLRGKQVDPRCDVYALGATLYHLLSRKPPHHAATADAMMKAAVDSPPTPIGELVAGVPAELSTIIDKALAHDADARYQNARELAEDLNRFVTGQLVASHHYTTKEKLLRFVKKHRVPVAAVSLALLVLVVGGIFAYVRVARARDRADAAAVVAVQEKQTAERERQKAEERNERLTLSGAWTHVESNPTLAVAMVRPLAGKHFREVRSIAAAARVNGVTWSLPASQVTGSLEMSRDGMAALAAGDDGVVRVYDLRKRTAQTIVETSDKVLARFADEERKIVVWHEARLTVIDRVGGGRRDLTVPTPIHDLELVGITAYWTDTAGSMWQLDLAGTQPLQIALDQRVHQIAPSPDGRWIALYGEDDLSLYDRTTPAEPPRHVATGRTRALDWSTDGTHFATLVDQVAIDVQMVPVPTIVRQLTVGERFFVAYGNNQLYTIGPTGVAAVSRDSAKPRRQLLGAPVGLSESRGGTMVAGSEEALAILSDRGDHTLRVPTGRLQLIATSAHSPYVLGAIDGRVLVWNLDELEPLALAPGAATAKLVGSDALIATFVEGPAQWIDLNTGKSRELGLWPAITQAADAPGGQLAAIVDLAHHAKLVAPGKEPEDLDGEVDWVGFATATQLVLGRLTGKVELHDASTGTRITLVEKKEEMIGLAWSRSEPAYVAAIFKDNTLWRTRLGGDAQTTKLPQKPNSSLYIGPDGTVHYAVGGTLMAWRPDDTIEPHATLPKPIIELGTTGTSSLVAFSEGGVAYLVDLTKPNHVTDIDRDLGRSTVAMAADTGLIVKEERGALVVIDPLTEHKRWTLADSPGVVLTRAGVSSDGRRVLAHTATGVLVWTIPMPASAEDTAAYLDKMTNAITGTGSKSLDWR